MAQSPFLLNLTWESQYFRNVFILTRMEIGAVHEVQLAVEGGGGRIVLNTSKPELGGVRHFHTEPWGL